MKELQTDDYLLFFAEIKQQIQQAQIKAMVAVNRQLLQLYWNMGNMIVERQKKFGWGRSVIKQLSEDLKREFPTARGYSERNLGYMKRFAGEYPDFEILQVPLAKITWYHNITLLEKVLDQDTRLWYAQKTLEHGWSRDVLVVQIETKLHLRQGKSVNNFEHILPKLQSDLAQQTLKDPYIFDFLNLTGDVLEKELEDALVKHITNFLLELGVGFAYIGRQYQIFVDDDEYKIDLLFYHLKLRSYVAIDLKTRQFKPEDVGKMNFYVNAIDDVLKTDLDNPTIGIILCKDKDSVKAEYTLKGINTPIGISEFKLNDALPDDFKSSLPTIEDLENRLKNI